MLRRSKIIKTLCRRLVCRLTALLFLSAFAGCTDSDDPLRGEVRGEVTLDGQPIDDGSISFEPIEDNVGPTSGGSIEAGHYRVRQSNGPAIGTNRVEINVPRKTGRQIPHPANPGATIDEIVEAAPPKYNERSEQVVDVKPGKNTFDFHMESE
jgi:hypothetical protein